MDKVSYCLAVAIFLKFVRHPKSTLFRYENAYNANVVSLVLLRSHLGRLLLAASHRNTKGGNKAESGNRGRTVVEEWRRVRYRTRVGEVQKGALGSLLVS